MMPRRDFLRMAAVTPLVPLAVKLPAAAESPTRTLFVVSRGAWNARRARPGMERHRPARLTVHHLGDSAIGPAEQVLRAVQSYHMDHSGHPDIDYHMVIDRSGRVFQGRNPRFRGDTHTSYDPSGHFLVCCLGDFEGIPGERRAHQPTERMVRSLVLTLAWASRRWSIDPATIAGHRDFADTDCPGRTLYPLVRSGELRRRVERVTRQGAIGKVMVTRT